MNCENFVSVCIQHKQLKLCSMIELTRYRENDFGETCHNLPVDGSNSMLLSIMEG